MNHFDSVADTVGEDLLGGGTNGWGRLYPRIKQCMESNGSIKPNFISLDWVLQVGEALEVAQYLNLNFGGRIGSGNAVSMTATVQQKLVTHCWMYVNAKSAC